MANHLKVDTDMLLETGRKLRTVATEFDTADKRTDEYGEVVGDQQLEDRLWDFSHDWDDKRQDMLDQIKKLAEASEKCGKAYEKVEQELYNTLMGKGGK